MATTAEDLIVNIKAKLDQAKRDTAAYQKQLNTLEEGATVPVKVKGGRDLDELFAKVSRLSAEDAEVVIGIETAKAQRDLKDLLYDISRLDAEDATIEVKAEQVAQVRGDLEQLEAKVKQLNDLPIEPGRGRDPGAGMQRIVDGADQANSAVSNMVGNASQDLGELTGVSGSAGVALGQLAEYFSDTAFAAKAAGQSMATAFKSFALASLPIAGISIVVGLLTSIATKAGEMGRKINEASRVAVTSLLDVAEAGGKLGEGLDDVAESAVTKIFEELGSKTPGVVDALRRMGITWDEVTEGFRTGGGDLADMLTLWDRFQAGVSLFGTRQAKLDFRKQLGLSEEDANTLLGDLEAVNDAFGESFTVQAKANEAASAAGQYRAEASDATEAAAEAEGKLAEETAKGTEEAERARAVAEEMAAALSEWAIKATQAEDALGELAGGFVQMGIRGDALTSLFDLGSAPLNMAGQVRDISLAIGDLSDAAEGIDLSKPLDPSNLKADKLLDALDALRPQIQTKVMEAFAAGGPSAAQATADGYVQSIVAELGGKLSKEEVEQLLSLDHLQADIAVALDLTAVENAKRQLAILVGVGGETPYTASIALALDAGTITGEQAQALVQAQLAGAGVDIPTALQAPDAPSFLAEAEAALSGTPVTVPSAADPAGAIDDVLGFTSAEQPPVVVPMGADAGAAEDERDAFVDDTDEAKATVGIDASTALAAAVVLAFLTMPRKANVYVDLPNINAVNTALALLARPRIADINARVQGAGTASAQLDAIAHPRESVITARVVESDVARWYRLNGRTG